MIFIDFYKLETDVSESGGLVEHYRQIVEQKKTQQDLVQARLSSTPKQYIQPVLQQNVSSSQHVAHNLAPNRENPQHPAHHSPLSDKSPQENKDQKTSDFASRHKRFAYLETGEDGMWYDLDEELVQTGWFVYQNFIIFFKSLIILTTATLEIKRFCCIELVRLIS